MRLSFFNRQSESDYKRMESPFYYKDNGVHRNFKRFSSVISVCSVGKRLFNNFTTKSQRHKVFPFESLRLRAFVVKKWDY